MSNLDPKKRSGKKNKRLFKNSSRQGLGLSSSVSKLAKSTVNNMSAKKVPKIKIQDEYGKLGTQQKDPRGYLKFKKVTSSDSKNSFGNASSTGYEPASSARYDNTSCQSSGPQSDADDYSHHGTKRGEMKASELL